MAPSYPPGAVAANRRRARHEVWRGGHTPRRVRALRSNRQWSLGVCTDGRSVAVGNARRAAGEPITQLSRRRTVHMRHHALRSLSWLPGLLWLALACERGPSQEQQAQIEQLSAATTERDNLMQDMAENTRLLSEISVELAKVQVPKRVLSGVSTESPLRAARDTMLHKIRYVTARIGEVENRLAA